MKIFERSFLVSKPLQAVADFHASPLALKRLSPPGVFVQFLQVEPLAEGSLAEFRMWFGPLPLRWRARHHDVQPLVGFVDVQEQGPLLSWQHRHKFEAVAASLTRVSDRIEYAHYPGWRGLWTRILFSRLGLRILFTYRAWATRRA